MKKTLLIILSIFALLNLSAQEKSFCKTINVKKFHEYCITMDDALILDCGCIPGYQEQHIENAVLIANSKMMNEELKDVDNNTVLLLYCGHGVRSKIASKMLIKLGFKKIYILRRGLKSWMKKGYKTTKY